jgi:UPF0716 protein FxsA
MAIMLKWFLLGMAALAVGEIAALIAVSAVLGLPAALALMLVTSLIGMAVLRHPGRARIKRLHEALVKSGIGGLEAGGDAFLTVAAGFLLLLPGFITDAVGLLLLVPPVRRWIGGRFQRSMQTRPSGSPGVVELERDEWNRVPERQIDDQRRPDNPS